MESPHWDQSHATGRDANTSPPSQKAILIPAPSPQHGFSLPAPPPARAAHIPGLSSSVPAGVLPPGTTLPSTRQITLTVAKEYVEENSYMGGMAQLQAQAHYVDSSNGYYDASTANLQPYSRMVDTYEAPAAQVYQPSPVVHAPIPILGAQFRARGGYETQEATVTDANFYPEPTTYRVISYAEPSYAEPHYTAQENFTQNVQQAQPQSWDEAVSQPFLCSTFPTPSELLIEIGSAYQDMPEAGSQCGSEGSRQSYEQSYGRISVGDFSSHPSPATIERAVDSASPESALSDHLRVPTPPRRPEIATRPAGSRVASSRSVSLLPDAAPSGSK